MVRKQIQAVCTVERRLCNDPQCPLHMPGSSQKKPSQSIKERLELCSSFLAERGCLTMNRPHGAPKQSAA